MSGLYRNDPETREGKYPVLLRRDGTVPEWEWFVLGARDPQAPHAIRDYASHCEEAGLDPKYVSDLRDMALNWDRAQELEAFKRDHGEPTPKPADPDGPRHRKDDPGVLGFPGSLAEYRERYQYHILSPDSHLTERDKRIADKLIGTGTSTIAAALRELLGIEVTP